MDATDDYYFRLLLKMKVNRPVRKRTALNSGLKASTTKRYELTPEAEAQLKPWAEMWLANALSTKPMIADDRSAMIEAVEGLYEVAGLKPPPRARIIFVASPFCAQVAAGFAAAIWCLRKHGKYKPVRPKAALKRCEQGDAWKAIWEATKIAACVDDPPLPPEAEFTGDDESWITGIGDMRACAASFGDPALLLNCTAKNQLIDGGNQWSPQVAFPSFFRHVAKLDLDWSKWRHYEAAAQHGGPRVMHEEFCLISDRPEVLSLDEQWRPHSDKGPAGRWRDGVEIWRIHGFHVPKFIVTNPEKLTADRILDEENAEDRRIMIERMGIERFVRESGLTPVQEDAAGRLYRMDDGTQFVRVVNATAEPDGSYREFFLAAGPETEIRTAMAAVADSFGLKEEQYKKLLPVMRQS